MKKFLLVIPLMLAGCSTLFGPVETIRNPQCTSIGEIQIIQIGKDVSLAEAVFYNETGWRKSDVIVKTEDLQIWDGDRYDDEWLSLKNGPACAVLDGTYSYTTVMGAQKTLIKITFRRSEIPNPEYEIWKAEQDKKAQDAKNKENADEHK